MRCPRCNRQLYLEEELEGYPLWCEECDENFFIFEGIEDYPGETSQYYEYINKLENKSD